MSDRISKIFYDELQVAIGTETSGRIYPNHLPHGSSVPAARYFLLHAGKRTNITGGGGTYLVRFQVDSITDDLETALELQRKLIDHFDLFSKVGPPNILWAETDYGTWFQEIDVQKYRSITDISLHTDGV